MLRFILSNILLAVTLISLIFLAGKLGWLSNLPSLWVESLILLLLGNTLIYKYLNKPHSPTFFTQLYLGTIVIKLTAYCGFCFWMIVIDKPEAASNLAFFLLAYVAFTTLEIAFLYRKISLENRRPGQGKKS